MAPRAGQTLARSIGYDFAADNRYLHFVSRNAVGDIWVMDVVADTPD